MVQKLNTIIRQSEERIRSILDKQEETFDLEDMSNEYFEKWRIENPDPNIEPFENIDQQALEELSTISSNAVKFPSGEMFDDCGLSFHVQSEDVIENV